MSTHFECACGKVHNNEIQGHCLVVFSLATNETTYHPYFLPNDVKQARRDRTKRDRVVRAARNRVETLIRLSEGHRETCACTHCNVLARMGAGGEW